MDAEKVLNYLSMVSNKNIALNIVMHLVVFAAILAVFIIKKQSIKRILIDGSLLVLFLSVTINALIYGNPFHLITFLILSLLAGFELFVKKNEFKIPQVNINTFIAVTLIVIGVWYPEFVNANKLQLLILSPVGIVPCPTLLVTIGLLSLSFPHVNKLQYTVTIVMGILFGVIGTFIFKVYFDVALLAAVAYGIVNLFRLRAQDKILPRM